MAIAGRIRIMSILWSLSLARNLRIQAAITDELTFRVLLLCLTKQKERTSAAKAALQAKFFLERLKPFP